MKKIVFVGLVFVLIMLCGKQCLAQIYVMRNYFPAPLEDTSYTRGFFGKMAFSAEGSRGFGSALDEQAWNMKYVGFVELFRFNARAAIAGSLAHEFSANPHNEINFHMRGAIWNETLSFFYKLNTFTLEAGITHHCRHEIDNTVPTNELDPEGHIPSRRLIVITAPYLSAQSNWLGNERLQSRFFARLNAYTYYVDGRHPHGNYEQSLDNLRASALLGVRINYTVHKYLQLYSRNWVNPAYFVEGEPVKSNFRLEIGAGIPGRKGNFELFGGYENFFDDMSRPYPLPSQVISVGIRGRSKDLF